MKKIGVVTTGQSPRPDITASILAILGAGYQLIEAGALDDLNIEDTENQPHFSDDELLVSRMRNGQQVSITKRFILPLLQQRIDELNLQDVQVIVVMCTGSFPKFDCKSLIVAPQEILKTVIRILLKNGKIGVICPTKEQMAATEQEYTKDNIEVYVDHLSPYEQKSQIQELANRLCQQNLDLIFLDCFGFETEIKQHLVKITGKPVIQANSLIASLLKELV